MSKQVLTERLSTILVEPHIKEKSMLLMGNRQVAFKVRVDATKPEVKAAVELMLDKKVDSVNILNVKGKSKRFGQYIGKRKNWKKAYVTLSEGQEVDFLGLE
ncbi:MAG: 50S ribosomal protein L23 [Gammaproteobacteria bacterium]|nr:50S ribosomal protein L23 [Gammaproteobacteria bacterium]NNC96598.1 50S ribosomal protein L23 [Gammaproteobacteria bacterium]NNM14823.1 50S ribosomal protein L23 [Gammaproteobacteria bacterium]